jgi:hypothetical protein
LAINKTNKTIFLPHLTVLGTLNIPETLKTTPLALFYASSTPVDMAAVEAVLPYIDEINKEKVRSLIINNYRNFAFKTDELCRTNLVKHIIDTKGKG